MIEFLTNNWKWIVAVGFELISLIVVLVTKKRPQVIDRSFIYQLCCWIEEAEKKYNDGAMKLSYVLDKASIYLGDRYDQSNVTATVEWLLTLPEKKGR